MIGGNGNGDNDVPAGETEEIEDGPETQDWEESDQDTPVSADR